MAMQASVLVVAAMATVVLMVVPAQAADVSFEASVTFNIPSGDYFQGPQLSFTDVNKNEGNGFLQAQNAFVVPVSGVYAFHIHILTSLYSKTAVNFNVLQLRVNGVEVALKVDSFRPSYWSMSTILSLDKGRAVTVWAYETQGFIFPDYQIPVVFSGTLLRQF